MIYIMKLTIIQRYFAPFLLIGVFAFTPFIAGAQDASVQSMFFPDLSTKGNSSIKEINNLNNLIQVQVLDSQSSVQGIDNVIDPIFLDILLQRRDLMLELAKDNPNLFLNSVLPDQTLTSLSTKNENYIKYLEQKITGDAVIDVTHSDDFENPENSRIDYTITIKEKSTGSRLQGISEPIETQLTFYPTQELDVISNTEVKVSGYKLQNVMVANTKSLAITETPVLGATGDQKTLVLLVKFNNSPATDPFTPEQAKDLVFNSPFQAFMKE